MMQYIEDSGIKLINAKEEVSSIGLMVLNIKDTGKTIWQMEKED